MNNNWKDRLTSFDNWKREGMNTLWVTTGLIGATFIDRLVQKAVDKWFPSVAPYVGYAKAGAMVLSGLGLSVAQDKGPDGDRMRLIGYGVSGSGFLSGLRMIPAVDQLMSDNTTAKTVETGSGLNGVERLLGIHLGDFGNAENIRQISTADAEKVELNLPDLGDSENNTRVYAPREDDEDSQMGEVEFEDVTAEVI